MTAELAEFVARGDLFVLTGAGLSTESGIPDYRKPDGTRRTVPMTFQQFLSGDDARRTGFAAPSGGNVSPRLGPTAATTLLQPCSAQVSCNTS